MKAKSKHKKDPKLTAGSSGGPTPRAESVVPKPSKEGACFSFVVDRPIFKLWIKALKVRYWIDFGSREEFNVKWDCATNSNGTINQRLIRVARLDDSVESLLFAVTCFETNCKIMVQGNHKDLWVETEFPILKKVVVGLREEADNISEIYKKSAGLDLDLSDEHMILSEDEDGHAGRVHDAAAEVGRDAVTERQPVRPMQVELSDDSDLESDTEFYGWLAKEVKKSSKEKTKGKKSPKRLRRSISVIPKKCVNYSVKQKDTKIDKSKLTAACSSDDHSQTLHDRILNLEDQVEKILNTISNREQNTVFQEELIKQIVDSAIKDILEDFKTQHKNSIVLLSRQLEENKRLYEEEIKKLKDLIEKQRGKLASANDRLNNVEKKLKDVDQRVTLVRNITTDEINQVKDEMLRLKDSANSSSEISKEKCEDLSNKVVPVCNSVEDQSEKSVIESHNVLGKSIIDETVMVYPNEEPQNQKEPKVVQSQTKGLVTKVCNDALIDNDDPADRGTSKGSAATGTLPVSGNIVEYGTGSNFNNNMGYTRVRNGKKWSSDIIVIMDSNRKFLEPEKLFPNKKSTILRCGNISSLNRIVEDPYFYNAESIVVHVGVNDIESNTDADVIADSLLTATAKLKSKFPTTNIFLSEITPRSDELQRKVICVNQHLKIKALKYNLHLIDHSNLRAKSFFFRDDRKHFNRSTGVRLLARNIKSKVLRQQPLISGEGVFKDLHSHRQSIELSNSLRSPRRMERENFYDERVKDPLNSVSSGQNSYAEAVREQPNLMNPRLNTSTERVREPVNFTNPRAPRDQVNFGYIDRQPEDRQPVDQISPGLPMFILSEMMKQLKNMNDNMMTLTHTFHSNRPPPGSGYVSTV